MREDNVALQDNRGKDGPSSSSPTIDPSFLDDLEEKPLPPPPRAKLLAAHFLRPTDDCNDTKLFFVPEQKSEAGRPRRGRERLGRGPKEILGFFFWFFLG